MDRTVSGVSVSTLVEEALEFQPVTEEATADENLLSSDGNLERKITAL
jgi:hypothetical protein